VSAPKQLKAEIVAYCAERAKQYAAAGVALLDQDGYPEFAALDELVAEIRDEALHPRLKDEA
jgi:hypothetical protein